MVHGARSCSAARRRRAKPRRTGRVVVERQRQTSSYRTRSAACGQPGLCASGTGGEWEQHLAARSGVQDQHGEHRQDGAEAHQPSQHHWQPQLLTLATSPVDGRCCATSGPLSRLCTAAPALADGRAECIFESVIPLEVAAAELVAPWLTRGAPSAIAISERFVAVSSHLLVDLPAWSGSAESRVL